MAYVKRAIFAVAGAGKTTTLVDSLSLAKRTLLLTYTDNNAENLFDAVLRKFGYIPENIMISTWFSFVLNCLIKPFVIAGGPETCRLIFSKDALPLYTKGFARYTTSDGGVFHSRAFEFVHQYVGKDKIQERLERFFDEILIDEVQDFAGYDFDFVELLGCSNVNVLITGDFFQHTYDTSRDGTKNMNLHKDFTAYVNRLRRYYQIDMSTLSKSHRCPKPICDFVRDKIGIPMDSFSNRTDISYPVLLTNQDEIQGVLKDPTIMKLFFREHYRYACNSANWGGCKGLSYNNVCVVLNKKTLAKFKSNRLAELPSSTRNKFYVACTRTKANLYFISEDDVIDYMA